MKKELENKLTKNEILSKILLKNILKQSSNINNETYATYNTVIMTDGAQRVQNTFTSNFRKNIS